MGGHTNLPLRGLAGLSLALLPMGVSAQSFIGVGFGYGSVNEEVEATITRNSLQLASVKDDSREGAPALFVTGGVDRHTSRTYGIVKGLPYENAVVSVFGVSHDWKFGDGPLKPFLGLTLGFAVLRWTEDVEADGFVFETEDETASSLGLGAQAGVLYDIGQSLSLEAGLRFLATDLNTEGSDQVMTVLGPATLEIEHTVESLVTFTLGFNYRF